MREGQQLIVTKCANGFTVDKYDGNFLGSKVVSSRRHVAGNSTHLGEIVMNLADDMDEDEALSKTHQVHVDELSERAYRPEDNGFVDPPKI